MWACPTMGPRTIGSKFKFCERWSYYIPFEPKFYSKQLLWKHFVVKINHSPVISHNAKVIDVIWRYQTSNVNSWYTYLQWSAILNNHNGFVLDLLIKKNEVDDDVMIMIEKIRKFSDVLYEFSKQFFKIIFQMFHAVVLIIYDLF